MEKETKRQWMQSFEGRIRVGPEYQAMIPPFCRNNFNSSQYRLNNNKDNVPSNLNQNTNGFMQSYVNNSIADDQNNDGDIITHLKFSSANSNINDDKNKISK